MKDVFYCSRKKALYSRGNEIIHQVIKTIQNYFVMSKLSDIIRNSFIIIWCQGPLNAGWSYQPIFQFLEFYVLVMLAWTLDMDWCVPVYLGICLVFKTCLHSWENASGPASVKWRAFLPLKWNLLCFFLA